jgi:phosphoglycerate dehydrogenase-like enzyme
VVLTPHMAAHTISAQRAQQRALLETLEAFFAGQPLTRRISG